MSRDVNIAKDLLIARALELIDNKDVRRIMGQNSWGEVGRTYSVKTEILRFQTQWQKLGEVAQKDKNEHRDIDSLLKYDYPRHSQLSNPSCKVCIRSWTNQSVNSEDKVL